MINKQNKVIAVIPAYNEEKRIGNVLRQVRNYVDEIVVSDDGSSDHTRRIAEEEGANVVSSPVNMGTGHATRLGCEYAIERMGANTIVVLDADGQHPPKEIPRLLKRIDQGYGFVFTSRLGEPGEMPVIKRIGNSILTFFTDIIAGVKISDSQSGFKAFTSDAYEKLDLKMDGYEICSEFALEVGGKFIRYCEIPIKATYDDWTKVKGTDFFTGVKIFFRLVWWRLTRWNGMGQNKSGGYQDHIYESKNPIVRYVTYTRIKKLLKYIGDEDTVLDAGCGDGYTTNIFAKHCKNAVGVDIIPERLKKAERMAKENGIEEKTSFVCSDLFKLDKALKEKFDTIICSEVIEHVEQPKQLLQTLITRMKDNGKIVLTYPNEEVLRMGRTLVFMNSADELEVKTDHKVVLTRKQVGGFARDLGLRIASYERIPNIPFFYLNELVVFEKIND
ncbi:MAG: glycosyltransferase [Candidatus Micrarchaeota archaeon]